MLNAFNKRQNGVLFERDTFQPVNQHKGVVHGIF